MDLLTHLDTEIEVAGIKGKDLLDLTSQEAHMRNALKSYKQIMANAPSINAPMATDCKCLPCETPNTDQNTYTSGVCSPSTTGCSSNAATQGTCYSSTAATCDCARGKTVADANQGQHDMMKRIQEWRSQSATASQELQTHAKALKTKLMETVYQSDHDKELASMNVNGLQKLINELNNERDQLFESVKELDTAQGVDSNLKIKYRSQHIQYIVFFIVTIIVVAILFRIQTSQESGAMELVVLIASVLFMIYHFYGWIKRGATGLWHWLNGLFNF